jgi:hypothetical protein
MTNGTAVGLTLMAICADPDEAHQCWRNLGPLCDEGVRTIVVMTGVPAKLYFKAHGSSYWRRIGHALAQVGIAASHPGPARVAAARAGAATDHHNHRRH